MKCAQCPKVFKPKKKTQRYCSPECRIAAGIARNGSKNGKSEPKLQEKQPTFASAEVIDLGMVVETAQLPQNSQKPEKPKKARNPSYAKMLFWRLKRRRAEKKQKGIEVLSTPMEKSSTSIEESSKVSKKKPKPRKEKFFSDAHPQQFALSRIFLPRLHTWALLIGLMYAGVMELVHRNQNFVLDWLNATPLPNIMDALMNFQAWFQKYGVAFILIMLFIIVTGFILYYLLWRLPFKNYSKRSEGAKTYEGRCYWRTNNALYRFWDRYYRSPPRTSNVYFLHVGWWPPLNVFDPSRSCIRIETSTQEKCQTKGIYDLIVDEYPIRAKKDNDPKWFVTMKEGYSSGIIPNEYVQGVFKVRGELLVDDTTTLSFGNADTRNQVMRSGLRLMTPKIRETIINARNKEQQQPDNH